MKLIPSSKNSTRPNSSQVKDRLPKTTPAALFCFIFLILFAGILSSCSPTYPKKTLTKQLVEVVKKEKNIDVTAKISGKTLWVYLPLEDLIHKDTETLNKAGLEKANDVINIVHHILLSTDADLKFFAVVACDINAFGFQIITTEYLQDFKEAVFEKFSRGEYFQRSLKEFRTASETIGDKTGASLRYQDINFDEFICKQIIHRTEIVFSQDKTLKKIFDIRSSSWSQKFGIYRIELELFKKTYNLPDDENKIDPLDYIKMIVALTVKNYNLKNFQVFEITDTFTEKTVKVTPEDINKIKINLPKIDI